jgi:gamma-glutamylaminecyclotransferase
MMGMVFKKSNRLLGPARRHRRDRKSNRNAMGAYVFVYGTLKRGFTNHARFLGSATWTGNYQTVRSFPLVLNGERCSPCLIDAPGSGRPVRGEVFEVDAATLAALDRLERTTAPDGYHRRLIEVAPCDEATSGNLRVYAYLKAPHLVAAAQSGNLAEYTRALGSRYIPRQRTR